MAIYKLWYKYVNGSDCMKRIISLSLLLCILFPVITDAQTPDLKETFLEAESYFLFEEYNEALPLYLRIQRADPANDNINYKIGICMLNDPYQKEKSIRYLELASKNINPKYKENNFKEKAAPLEVYYYLGQAYLINDNIDKALENFLYFRENLDEKIYDVELLDEQISTCERARYLMQKPVDFDLINLGEKINSRFADINPIISGNGQRLVYVSKMQFYDAVFFSEKKDGQWQPPRNIIPELGVDGDVYPTCLSRDGNTMIIYRSDDFIGNLYISRYANEQWTAMEKMGSEINTRYWESHASFSKDGNTLYFTSNRKNGFGGLDIYKTEKLEDGTWGTPQNLGNKINTRYNEETPFITENGKKLFFSSYGHYNMGGYDIFYSEINEAGEWGIPINLGYPINTTGDDLFYFPLNNGTNAYLSKFKKDGWGRHDLYYLDLISENNPRIYIVKGSLAAGKEVITEEDSLMIYLIDRDSKDTVHVGRPQLTTQTFEVKATEGDYDMLFQSVTFNDLIRRIVINESTEKAGITIDEALVLEPKVYEPKLLTGNESRIIVDDTLYNVKAGRILKIGMQLEEGSVLYASQTIGNRTITTDSFLIEQERFIYELIPAAGMNVVDFTLVEENGDKSLKRVLVDAEKVKKAPPAVKKEPPVSVAPEKTPAKEPEKVRKEHEIVKTEPGVEEEREPDQEPVQPEPKKILPAIVVMGVGLLLAGILFLILFFLRRRKNE
ncbi:MAG: hypothetical protein WD578_06490 [Bacteroidales bacterium]